MQLLEQEKPAFKQWLLPKLANRSDAEPDVLADYVAELFGNNGSKDQIAEQLSEFLGDHSQTFVDEIAKGVDQKSWLAKPTIERKKKAGGKEKAKDHTRPTAQPTTAPAHRTETTATTLRSVAQPTKSTLTPDAPIFVPRAQAVVGAALGGRTTPLSNAATIPTGPRADRINGEQQSQVHANKIINSRQKQPKKRKLHERDTSQSRNSGSDYNADNSASERPHKQLARRGEGVGRNGSRTNPTAATATTSGMSTNGATFHPRAGQLPPPTLPQFPPMDPSSPFLNIMANMSGVMSQLFSGQTFGAQIPHIPKTKCPDYETKGICKLGTYCPYDHGEAIVVPADPQYDPNNSSLAMPQTNGRQTSNGVHSSPLIPRRREDRHVTFAQSAPSRGLNDTVVVEQIPEDHFTETHVRNFFSQFGAIVNVQMHAYKRLAIVKFSDHPAAQRAYDSPKVIFDNRFVKVYWHKPEESPQDDRTNGTAMQAPTQGVVPEIYNEDQDMVDLEEVRKKQAQAQKEFEERQRKAEEVTARSNMLKAQAKAKEEEAKQLRARVIEMERAKGVEAIKQREKRTPTNDLAKLQFEAAGLFANAESATPPNVGRGGFSGGRGSPFRGSFRGRGNARGGVVRLDNRPRRLVVAGVKAGSAKERALKQYLLNVKGCNGVYPHAERANALVVGFDQRYQAELFLNEAPRISGVSLADLSWIPNDAAVVQQSIESEEPARLEHDTDAEMSDGQVEPKVEVDLDVADDNDQWL